MGIWRGNTVQPITEMLPLPIRNCGPHLSPGDPVPRRGLYLIHFPAQTLRCLVPASWPGVLVPAPLLHPPSRCIFQFPHKLSVPAWVWNQLKISPKLCLLWTLEGIVPLTGPQTVTPSGLHPLLSTLLPNSGPNLKAGCCSQLPAQGPQPSRAQPGPILPSSVCQAGNNAAEAPDRFRAR